MSDPTSVVRLVDDDSSLRGGLAFALEMALNQAGIPFRSIRFRFLLWTFFVENRTRESSIRLFAQYVSYIYSASRDYRDC